MQVFHPRAAKAGVWVFVSKFIGVVIFAAVKHLPTLFLQALLCLSLCRCSFNRIVVTALDSDVNIISPTSNRNAYLMTCGHPCEPAGLVVLDMTPFMQLVMLDRFCSLKFKVRKPWNSSVPAMCKVLSTGLMVSRWGSRSIWCQRGSRPIWESYKYLATVFCQLSVSVRNLMACFSYPNNENFLQVAKVDSRCAGRWHCKESNATTSSHKQTYVVLAFTVPLPTDGSADELVAALKRLGFPLDGAEGVLHPLPPALVAADARKRMAKSKYLKLFRKEAKPKKAGWLFSISKASSVTTLACQRCQTFYTCWGILQPVPLQLLRQDSERAEAEKGEKGQEGEEKGLDSKA